MHIALEDDITLRIGTGCGRMAIQVEIGNGNERRHLILICIQCINRNLTRGGITVHMARKRRDLHRHYDIQRPLCPKIHKDPGSLNRRLYKNNVFT